jgi:D-beta-D-heptose 7-phosphate kinase/D-beta-D-heptose 1-phosphate adenosyltransferase
MSRLHAIESKIVTLEEAQRRMAMWHMKGAKVVFTNGCFDILHMGHVTYLAKTAGLGDQLVVGINSDDSVRRLEKGSNRPINAETARAFVLASLGVVDMVVLFSEDTPEVLIHALEPDVLVKGADYDPNETDATAKTYIVGSDFVRKHGGEVHVVDIVDGFSTTGIVTKMKQG